MSCPINQHSRSRDRSVRLPLCLISGSDVTMHSTRRPLFRNRLAGFLVVGTCIAIFVFALIAVLVLVLDDSGTGVTRVPENTTPEARTYAFAVVVEGEGLEMLEWQTDRRTGQFTGEHTTVSLSDLGNPGAVPEEIRDVDPIAGTQKGDSIEFTRNSFQIGPVSGSIGNDGRLRLNTDIGLQAVDQAWEPTDPQDFEKAVLDYRDKHRIRPRR